MLVWTIWKAGAWRRRTLCAACVMHIAQLPLNRNGQKQARVEIAGQAGKRRTLWLLFNYWSEAAELCKRRRIVVACHCKTLCLFTSSSLPRQTSLQPLTCSNTKRAETSPHPSAVRRHMLKCSTKGVFQQVEPYGLFQMDSGWCKDHSK